MKKRHPEYLYLDLLKELLEHGVDKDDRTGTGTASLFGRQIRFDLGENFPLLTTKKIFLRGIIHELLWFLKGESNIKYLVDHDVHIWDSWPYRYYRETMEQAPAGAQTPFLRQSKKIVSSPEILSQQEFIERIKTDDNFAKKWGDLGPVYGVQWRHWPKPDGGEIDQISNVIKEIKKNPNSRRLIVSAWNAAEIEKMAVSGLPPCHTMFQFCVLDGKLSCQLYQRSADTFLGVPFNIASYSLLTLMVAQVTGLKPGEFVHTFGDLHIYKNHRQAVKEQLTRQPRLFPKMKLNKKVSSIFEFTINDFTLEGYDPHPPIKAPVAV